MRAPLVVLLLCASGCTPCSQALRVPEPSLERMIEQPRVDPLEPSAFFPDGTNIRPVPPGVLAWGKKPQKPALDAALLDEGQRDYDVICGACHGVLGDGNTIVARHMEMVKPRDLNSKDLRAKGPEHFYKIATEGYGLMPSYADHLDERERWAVAYYIKALQLSRHAELGSLPQQVQNSLRAKGGGS